MNEKKSKPTKPTSPGVTDEELAALFRSPPLRGTKKSGPLTCADIEKGNMPLLYVLNDLQGSDRKWFEGHLKICAECRLVMIAISVAFDVTQVEAAAKNPQSED